MSDETPLSRKLATLSGQDIYDGQALHLSASGAPDAVQQIMHAIDDTMLPRDCVFAVGDAAVTLRVSGRRLLTVVAASDTLGAPADLFGQSLSSDAPDAVRQVGDLLCALVAQEGVLTLTRLPAGDETPSGSGIDSQNLGAYLDTPSPVQDAMDEFFEGLRPVARVIVIGCLEEIETVEGPDDLAETLQSVLADQWPRFAAEHNGLARVEPDPQLCVLDGLAPDNLGFVAVRMGQKRCFALVPMDAAVQVCAIWSALRL